jgi:hypothetical protein
MPRKIYVVTLDAEERSYLQEIVSKGKASAHKRLHAQILLKADAGPHGPRWKDEQVAEAFDVRRRTVERVRQRFVEEGLEAALNRKKREVKKLPKIDGEVEAHLVAAACGEPPEGRSRWTLRLLADHLVELELVDSVSHETVRQTVKLPAASRGASLAQLEFKLRRPLLQLMMMLDIFLNHLTSHSVTNRAGKITILPQLTTPKTPFERRELAEQLPCANAFDDTNHFTDRTFRGKRKQNMYMVQRNLKLNDLKAISLAYFTDQLFRSSLQLRTLKKLLTILRTPNQMVTRVVDRMTRSFYTHTSFYITALSKGLGRIRGTLRSPL